MIKLCKNFDHRKKRVICIKFVLFSILFIFFSIRTYAQDSIALAKDLTEEKELKFQQFFFNALSQKSIGNYQKAIENLENCNQILTNDVSVFFEFSKNYLQLNKTLLAKEYIKRALVKDPDNIWMLKHLIKINVKAKDYANAIIVQKKLVVNNIKEKKLLVNLYLWNKEYKKAVSVMNNMERDNSLPLNLKKIKNNLENRKSKSVTEEKINSTISLKDKFKSDKSYGVLRQILNNSENDFKELLKYANEGITLFPAQPYIYLMKGKALNYQKKYKKALTILKSGIDFVIEGKMEANFYNEMAKSYKGLGNSKEEKKYQEKYKKLKN